MNGLMWIAEEIAQRHKAYDWTTHQHASRVSGNFSGRPEALAYLHAAVENAPAENRDALREDIRGKFGDDALATIDALTRGDGETYREYIARCAMDGDARKIKIADIRDNLRRCDWPGMGHDGIERFLYPCPPSMKQRYASALRTLNIAAQ